MEDRNGYTTRHDARLHAKEQPRPKTQQEKLLWPDRAGNDPSTDHGDQGGQPRKPIVPGRHALDVTQPTAPLRDAARCEEGNVEWESPHGHRRYVEETKLAVIDPSLDSPQS